MRSNVVAEASAIGRLTSTVLKSSARKEIMNDGESKNGNISAESSIFGRKMADQQGSFSVFVPPLTYKNNNNQSNLQRDRDETSWPKPFNLVWIVRCFETADLTISVIPPFISKTTNKRGHACNPTVTYCSVTRAITRVTYTFDNAVSLLELDFRAEASAIRRSSSSKLIASTKA